MAIPLGPASPRRLARPTRTTGPETACPTPRGAAPSSLFGLAPGGVCRAAAVAGGAVRSYRTLSPLPAGRRSRPRRAVCSLWHFPWGRPRRALPGTVFPWSPDFPPPPRGGSGHPAVCTAHLANPRGRRLARRRPRAPGPSSAPSSTPSQRAGRQRRWKARRSAAARHALRLAGIAECGQCRRGQDRIRRGATGSRWRRQAQATHAASRRQSNNSPGSSLRSGAMSLWADHAARRDPPALHDASRPARPVLPSGARGTGGSPIRVRD